MLAPLGMTDRRDYTTKSVPPDEGRYSVGQHRIGSYRLPAAKALKPLSQVAPTAITE